MQLLMHGSRVHKNMDGVDLHHNLLLTSSHSLAKRQILTQLVMQHSIDTLLYHKVEKL